MEKSPAGETMLEEVWVLMFYDLRYQEECVSTSIVGIFASHDAAVAAVPVETIQWAPNWGEIHGHKEKFLLEDIGVDHGIDHEENEWSIYPQPLGVVELPFAVFYY